MTGQQPRSARRVANAAQDRKTGMSLGDVAQFVADAYSAGLTDAAEVRVQIGWRAQVLTASAEGVPGDGIPQQHNDQEQRTMKTTTAALITATAALAYQAPPVRRWASRVGHVALCRPLMYRIHIEDGGALVRTDHTRVERSRWKVGPNDEQIAAAETIERMLAVLNGRGPAVHVRGASRVTVMNNIIESTQGGYRP